MIRDWLVKRRETAGSVERVRLIEMTGTLPIEVTLGASEDTSAPHAA